MKKLILGIAALSALLISSCDEDGKNGSADKLPTAIIHEEGRVEYAYDAANRLTKMTYHDLNKGKNAIQDAIYFYNDDKLVEVAVYKPETTDTIYHRATYIGSTQVRVVATSTSSDYNGYDTFLYELNSKGQAVSNGIGDTYKYAADGTLSERNMDGSIIFKYTYDSKNGICKNWNMPSWYMLNDGLMQFKIHNTKKTEFSYVNDEKTDVYINDMQYDTDGFPVKWTRTKNGEPDGESTIVYNK